MIHFGMQFSHTDLFIFKKYLQFPFNEINECCGNYMHSLGYSMLLKTGSNG